MPGGVGVLVACACAAVLLLAWRFARRRPSAKRTGDSLLGAPGPEKDGVATLPPDAPERISASSAVADPTVPDRFDDADGVRGVLALTVPDDETQPDTPTKIVQQLAPASERGPEDDTETDETTSNHVTDPPASEALRQTPVREMPEGASTLAEPANEAADAWDSTDLPEATDDASDEGGADQVPARSATHQYHASNPGLESEGVIGTDRVDGKLEQASPEPSELPAAGPQHETAQADDVAADEAEPKEFLSTAEAAPTARGPDRDEIDAASEPATPAASPRRTSGPAQHRDRRGQRRSIPSVAAADEPAAAARPSEAPRPPAEAKFRLELHPIRRTASLSAILTRPDGFPSAVHVALDGEQELTAYDETRYDDLLLTWSEVLLADEIRLDSREGFQWLRSARRVHLFQELPDEVGLVSTGAAKAAQQHAVVCAISDAGAVRAAAAACGSPPLTASDGWSGVPAGWTVLSNYCPAHAPAESLPPGLTSMDPGNATEIRLAGGLLVRSGLYAEGHPPRIEIDALPAGAQVTIDGLPAERDADAWIADGWQSPGQHLVDVVPGPSATYRVIEDPWPKKRWEPWEAHPRRFGAEGNAPWQQVEICGACVSAPGGRHVVVAPTSASVVVLGLARGVTLLRPREGVPVAMALASETPAFLVSTSGPRRAQGRVEWLSPAPSSTEGRGIDAGWVAAVRLAAARRLPVDSLSAAADRAWQRARERARRYRRRGRD